MKQSRKRGRRKRKKRKISKRKCNCTFLLLVLYYMYMYVVIQNHVQNTSLLLYVNVAFWMQFAIFLSFFTILDRDKYATKTNNEYGDELHTPKRKSTCFCGWGGRHFFPFPRKIHFVGVGVLLAAAAASNSIQFIDKRTFEFVCVGVCVRAVYLCAVFAIKFINKINAHSFFYPQY